MTTPPSYGGGSGSPIFIKNQGNSGNKQIEWYELVGMQSANASRPSQLFGGTPVAIGTLIVKEEQIYDLYNKLKYA